LPGYRGMRDNAAAIVIGSRATWNQLGGRWTPKAVYIPENAVRGDRVAADVTRSSSAPLRVIFVGRLVPYKGADMLMEACAGLIKAGKVQLEIVGDGPQKTRLQQTVEEQRLGGGVSFTGWLDNAAVAARLSQAHVLGFPSIREFGGGAVLEAMAAGAVPLVVDYGGPSELVTPETGYLVPLGSREAIIGALRAQLETLVADSRPLAEKATRGRDRVERWFTWGRKAEQIAAIYDWVLLRGTKPDFGMPFPDRASDLNLGQ
jgi:glycosyltransferase involved in cell wall biosynthesis